MAKGQYLFGPRAMAVTQRIVVAVMVTQTVFTLCPSVAYHSMDENPGISRSVPQHWRQPTVAAPTMKNKS